MCMVTCKTDSEWEAAVSHGELSPGPCGDLHRWHEVERGRVVQEGQTAGSLHCIAETNTTLQSNYTPI